MTFHSLARPAWLAAIIALTTPVSAHAEDVLRALHAFPASDNTSQLFLRFVDDVNQRSEGVLRITVAGGPEVVPGLQQIESVGRGVVDMAMGPISYALGTMPEADAWVGSNVTPMESRQNGGLALMQTAAAERLGVHLLGRFAPSAPIHLFLLKEPAMTAEGDIDFAGLRLRASPLYNAFYESLGAVPVSIPVPDIYTGLERGTFDGMGYPPSAMEGWSWERFLKYRIEPGILQSDLGLYVAPATWDRMSDAAKALLDEVVAEYEDSAYAEWQTLTQEVNDRFDAQGMQPVTLEGEAAQRYSDAAFASVWSRLEASGSPYAADLRAAYFRP